MVARQMPSNPPQVAQMLGGSPPGMPPVNAFDLDPTELDRMLAEGWTIYDDGEMAPPPTPGQMPVGMGTEQSPGGYADAGPGVGPGPAIGGNSRPAPPLPPEVPQLPNLSGGLPGQTGAIPPMGGGPGVPVEPIPPVDAALGLGGAVPGIPGIAGLGSPAGNLGPGIGAAPITPTPLGPPLGPPTAPPGVMADPTLGGLGAAPVVEPVGLDPFAYVAEQNRNAMAPAQGRGGSGDPGGYLGPDVAGSDPLKTFPPRRRRASPNGGQQRLTNQTRIGQYQPRPQRRP